MSEQHVNQVYYLLSPILGCDPELFLAKKGRIIGAEKVLDDKGLQELGLNGKPVSPSKCVLDGVQIELNPSPSACREGLAMQLASTFKALRQKLASMADKEITASFSAVVDVDKDELDTLSDKAKQLGCAPSLNSYDSKASIGLLDPAAYTKRSAGGHIHLGLLGYNSNLAVASPQARALYAEREKLIPILDILLGNTCVLIDRDPLAQERRKVYGRAGEYRLPPHGVEYRTLSNFWLQSYPLMSFVFGVSKMAVQVLAAKFFAYGSPHYPANTFQPPWDAPSTLLSMVDLDAVRYAINENDLTLAKRNFEQVKEFIGKHVSPASNWSLGPRELTRFDHFVKRLDEGGLPYWFKADPFTHWCELRTGHGWESFLADEVSRDLAAQAQGLPIDILSGPEVRAAL